MPLPESTNALIVVPASQARKPTYHDIRLVSRTVPKLQDGQILVRIGAVGFNHRDVWIRRHLYPNIALGSVLGSDAAGVVIASPDASDPLVGQRVFLTPSRGWESAGNAPESTFGIVGGCKFPDLGVFSEFVVVERKQVVPTPVHLDDEHAAAWPLAGVTAWRAVAVHGNVCAGQTVLITGIGGGVAMIALQLCVALGSNVYITSGDERKIAKACELGAKGGVNYKSKTWPAQLASKLKEHGSRGIDVVVDSAGGDICANVRRIMNHGGKIVCYGMTANPTITFTMHEVLQNIELKGSMMGSHRELLEATDFLAKHKIIPLVSEIIDGLENAEQGFQSLANGSQLGKVVIRLRPTVGQTAKSKL